MKPRSKIGGRMSEENVSDIIETLLAGEGLDTESEAIIILEMIEPEPEEGG